MAERNYLQLLAETTPTQFWNDSGEPAEIRTALANGACGVTTNPILITRSVLAHADEWQARIRHMARTTAPAELPHEITAQIVCHAADMLLSTWVRTQGKAGWVCAQGNPNNFNNAGAMVDEALAFASLRPNIATKIPVSEAGLAAIEELTTHGVTTTCTTSFTVPQVVHIAEAFHRGLSRLAASIPRQSVNCFAVIMAGRLDDHLRDEISAGRGVAGEDAITISGLAVTKRAYELFQQRRYEAVLLVGGMRGQYHVTELAGGRMVLTISPAMQAAIAGKSIGARMTGKASGLHVTIVEPVAGALLEAMRAVPDFVRAYEPEGMTPAEFSTFGAFAKTQGQFIDNYRQLVGFIEKSLS